MLGKYVKTCGQNTPGNIVVAIADPEAIATVTITSDEVSAITAVVTSTPAFKELEVDIDSLQRIENVVSNQNTNVTHQVVMGFSKPSKTLQTLRKSLATQANCGIVAIVLDGNGQAWLVGWGATEKGRRALRNVTDNLDSGTVPSDTGVQRATITLEGMDSDFDIPFDASLTAAIVAGTSTIIDWA